MTPAEALQRIVHCLDRAHVTGFKTKAWVRALDVVRTTDPDELADRAAAGTLTDLPGIGDSTARVIKEALDGQVPAYHTKLEAETVIELSPEAQVYRDALRGDCHLHSTWSDGGATIEEMAATAISLGHEYMVLTDHSARLTIAHGLDRERLLAQFEDLAVLNEQLAPFRILTGMEVDILGHCTGRLIGKRPESVFDADYVFAACAQFGTAVEINSRPERLDPPQELLDVALSYGCYVSIDSDAHATGQLEWQPHGCEKAAASAVPIERVINTWAIEDLLAWTETSEAA